MMEPFRKGTVRMEKYENLEMEIIVFESEDVITTSNEIPLPDMP